MLPLVTSQQVLPMSAPPIRSSPYASYADVVRAREALLPLIGASPTRHYPQLDDLVGHGIRVLVKHDNHLPVNTFKIRNAVTALLALDAAAASNGVAAASTGNHGQGVAWAGARLGIPVTVFVPEGNNPEKNATIKALGARLVEAGATYDECVAHCAETAARDGMVVVHSTNNAGVIAGAATLAAEFLEQAPELEALVLALGGGSQSTGAIIVRDAVKPSIEIFAAQSDQARAQHDAFHDGQPRTGEPAATFAEGIACGSTYEFTFDTLRRGLADFTLVRDADIAQAIRDLLRITHNLAEGAGATGLAGLRKLAPRLGGRNVGIVMCGGNLDAGTLKRVLAEEL